MLPARHREMFNIAAQFAVRRDLIDLRGHLVGAAGLRSDGAIVRARNSASPEKNMQAHAEWKLSKKLDHGADVWVVRVRKCGGFGLAKPCVTCHYKLLRSSVRRVYYTIDSNEFGTIFFNRA